MIAGIDPGVAGAIVVNDNGTLAVLDMPTFEVPRGKGKRKVIDGLEVCHFLSIFASQLDLVIIEEVGSRPGNAGSAMFNFGYGAGLIHGVCVGLGLQVAHVRPQKWTKALGVGPDKNRHRDEAKLRFPGQADLFNLVKHDGRADGALITVWAGGR